MQQKQLKTTEAQRRATAKWDRDNTEKITLKLYRSKDPSKAQIQAAAEAAGQSVNAWIVDAIKQSL